MHYRVNMIYLRTKLATNWGKQTPRTIRDCLEQVAGKFDCNPDYRKSLPEISEWLVEFDDEGRPGREIALDSSGRPLFCGPDEHNYGFWLDTNMMFQDFDGSPLTEEEFERIWDLLS